MAVKKTGKVAVKKTAKQGAVKNSARVVKNSARAVKTARPVKKDVKLNLDIQKLEEAVTKLNEQLENFKKIRSLYNNLTPKERERLISAGVRNYGFIEKANDIGKDNPAFLPPQFNMQMFSENLQEFDLVRQFYFIAEKIQTLSSDSMLIESNELYRDALRIYNGLKEQAKGRVPGAKDLFDALEPFFKRRRVVESQPTQKEEMRKLKSIAKGKTEGEVLVRNIKPKTSGGVREVIEVTGKEIRNEELEIRNNE
jgi:hypothetical protein